MKITLTSFLALTIMQRKAIVEGIEIWARGEHQSAQAYFAGMATRILTPCAVSDKDLDIVLTFAPILINMPKGDGWGNGRRNTVFAAYHWLGAPTVFKQGDMSAAIRKIRAMLDDMIPPVKCGNCDGIISREEPGHTCPMPVGQLARLDAANRAVARDEKIEALARVESAQCVFSFAWSTLARHFDNSPDEEARVAMHRIQNDLERIVRTLKR